MDVDLRRQGPACAGNGRRKERGVCNENDVKCEQEPADYTLPRFEEGDNWSDWRGGCLI